MRNHNSAEPAAQPAALQLLRSIIQELDFDEAEGHPPGEVLAELRDQARQLLKETPRRRNGSADRP